MDRDYPRHCYTMRDTLLRIGIPIDLVNSSLNASSEGLALEKWLINQGYQSLLRGENWYFQTSKAESFKTLPLLVKTLKLTSQINAFFARTHYLARLLMERNHKEFNVVAASRVLVLADFYEVSRSRRDCPMTPTQRGYIESMLLERSDKGRATIFHIYNPSELKVDHLDWWRSSVFDQLTPKSLKIAPILVDA